MNRLAAAAVLALAAACGRLDQVNVTRSASATIPGTPGGAALPPASVSGLRIELGSALLKQQGISPKDLDGAKLRTLHLAVTAGRPLEEWLDAITLRAEGTGLPTVVIAEKSGISGLPAGTTAIDLDVPPVELKPYLEAQTAAISADASGRAPSADTTVQATATIRVDVSVSGLLR